MPSRKVKAQNLEHSKLAHPQKLKRIRKLSDLRTKHSPSTPSDFSSPHYLPANSISGPTATSLSSSALSLVILVRGLNQNMGYKADTYLAGLRLLHRLKFQTASICRADSNPRLLAAATVALTAKVHEFRTPTFKDLRAKSFYEFSQADLKMQEAQLLQLIGFAVPTVLECRTVKEMQRAIYDLERSLLSLELAFQ